MSPIYAIADIHGQHEMLDAALERVERDGGPDAKVVFLGDLTDRGPDSRGVLDLLIAGRDAGRDWTFLKGNHDRMFLRFLRDGNPHDGRIASGKGWLNPALGGSATLASYGVADADTRPMQDVLAEAREAVPQAHLDFLGDLNPYLEYGPLLFVHAGIRPRVPLEKQTEDDLVWIREGFLDYRKPHPWLVVHGHTALEVPQHFGNRVDLDSGAGYGNTLTAALFEGRECFMLEPGGRVAL